MDPVLLLGQGGPMVTLGLPEWAPAGFQSSLLDEAPESGEWALNRFLLWPPRV
jgi:hypothetical protein